VPSVQQLTQAAQGDAVRAAEPVDHERHQHLRVELEDPAHQRMFRRAPRDMDDLPDQAPASGRLAPGPLSGLGDDSPELHDQQGADEPVEVVVAAVDSHPAHPRPAGDLGQGQAAEADLQDALVRGPEHRIIGGRGPARASRQV